MKLTTLFKWMRLCKNWHTIVAFRLGLVKGDNDIIVKLRNGLNLKLLNSGINNDAVVVLGDIYMERPYRRFGRDLKENDVVVDIGANIGVFSTLAVLEAENVKVYAYEASPKNFEYLKHNIDANNLGKKVKGFNMAVSSTEGKAKLYIHEPGCGGHSLFRELVESKNKAYVEVESTTLTDIILLNKLERINLLKLDCEGAEYNILMNTPKEYLDRIDKIVLEYHTIKEHTPKDLVDFLLDQNFEVSRIPNKIYARRIS